ncbi:uncharacterized protein LOC131247134 [Magnolia sinica]|uniref:uncharacterized protein LOC131247134 n=1 Tax=Magnolia sinica TaxID=86752 RepID=UPI002659DCB1|nr:uncharacterized protein LOC131247134 [Magnolia sinica]
MKVVSWNVRGLGSKQKRRLIKHSCRRSNPDVICLQETKVRQFSDSLMESIWKSKDVRWTALHASGSFGGILVAWNSSRWSLIDTWSGTYSVSVILHDALSDFRYLVSSVHGPNSEDSRKDFWVELSASRLCFSDPTCLVGDFNMIRFVEEKSHGNKVSPAMGAFSAWIDDQDLVDLPLLGARFTWTNGRASPILSRLDRFLLSPEWLDYFSFISQSALPITTSDHCPILLSAEETNLGPKPFRFDSWVKIDSFRQIVADWWGDFKVEGFAGYKLCFKFKLLKEKIKRWKLQHLLKRQLDLDVITSQLQKIDAGIEASETSLDILSTRIQLIQSLSSRILEDEISWKLKSRVKWLKEGDKNTKFFHSITNMHARYNKISSIVVNEVRVKDKNAIVEAASDHFSSLLKGNNRDGLGLDDLHLEAVSVKEASLLELPFSEEVKLVTLGGDKAPGPDGFPISFFRLF